MSIAMINHLIFFFRKLIFSFIFKSPLIFFAIKKIFTNDNFTINVWNKRSPYFAISLIQVLMKTKNKNTLYATNVWTPAC